MIKRGILFIDPGTTYRPKTYSYQRKMLSKNFSGYIFTTSGATEKIQIGNFIYLSMQSKFTLISIFKFVLFCVWNDRKLLRNKERVDLVVTFDPLVTGMIGLIVSRILKAKFAPQVNGVHTSPAEWVDDPDSLLTRFKKIFIL